METHGCLGGEFQQFLRRCARRAESISRGEIPEDRFAPEESDSEMSGRGVRLLGYYRQRVAVALQREQALLIHRRAARALERATPVVGPLELQRVAAGDLFTVTRLAGDRGLA